MLTWVGPSNSYSATQSQIFPRMCYWFVRCSSWCALIYRSFEVSHPWTPTILKCISHRPTTPLFLSFIMIAPGTASHSARFAHHLVDLFGWKLTNSGIRTIRDHSSRLGKIWLRSVNWYSRHLVQCGTDLSHTFPNFTELVTFHQNDWPDFTDDVRTRCYIYGVSDHIIAGREVYDF